jgi:endonuclease YncB( thermonuclease family)
MIGLFLLLAFPSFAFAKDIAGVASRIVDGDTLYVCDETVCEKIRLCGIDAPERKDAMGIQATSALKHIAGDKTLRCVRVGEGSVCDGRSRPMSRDRIVAQCFVGKDDVAGLMVGRGYACDWRKFSGGYYRKFELSNACSQELGISTGD